MIHSLCFTHLKCTIDTFSVFTVHLGTCHHILFQNHPITPKRTPIHVSRHSPFSPSPSSRALGNKPVNFLSGDFPVPDIS